MTVKQLIIETVEDINNSLEELDYTTKKLKGSRVEANSGMELDSIDAVIVRCVRIKNDSLSHLKEIDSIKNKL